MFRFNLFRVPIEVTGSFWLATVLLGSVGNSFDSQGDIIRLLIWIACVFVSIVVHEMGHALVGRSYGGDPYVVLQGMGGLCYRNGPPLSRPKSIAISLAGPAFGFGLFLLVLAIRTFLVATRPANLDMGLLAIPEVRVAIFYLLYINGFWTLFNLLPVLPLDGGRVCEDMLGPSRVQITRIIGAVVAVAVCAYAAWGGQYYIAIFMGYLAYANFTGNTRNIL